MSTPLPPWLTDLLNGSSTTTIHDLGSKFGTVGPGTHTQELVMYCVGESRSAHLEVSVNLTVERRDNSIPIREFL